MPSILQDIAEIEKDISAEMAEASSPERPQSFVERVVSNTEAPQEQQEVSSPERPQSFVERISNTEAPQEQQGVSSQEREANSFARRATERKDAGRNGGCRIM